MKKVWWLVALGVVAFLVLAVATLPASVLVAPLEKQAIILNGVTGTVWNGAAQVLQSGNIRMGSVEWHVHPLALLRGRAAADVKLTRVDGFVQGYVEANTAGSIALRDVSGALPLSVLPPQLTAGGWDGKLNLRLTAAQIVNRWPAMLVGAIEVRELLGPARRPTAMGSYKLVFPEQAQPDVLAGALTDINGPLQLAGTLQLKAADRSYVFDGLVATRPDAPADLVNSLQFLGAPDAQGQRQLSIAGTM
jgi:general secretion pathway protein N